MKDNETLKAPAFEMCDCGVEIGGSRISFGAVAERLRDVEEITIDSRLNTRLKPGAKRSAKDTEELLQRLHLVPAAETADAAALRLKPAETAFAASRLTRRQRIA